MLDSLPALLPHLRRYSRALTGVREDADDLVQDTVRRALEKRYQFRLGSNPRTWLFAIMHSIHIDTVRRLRASVSLDADDVPENLPELSTPATQTSRLLGRDIQAALMALPLEQREVLLLVTLEDMQYEEVAQSLGIPIGTVMSRLSRARERVRLHMDGKPFAEKLRAVK
jgi:RNA polymerase sigma factor (sigma-70 family)